MARTKTPSAQPELETVEDSPAEPVAKARGAEPTTVSVSAQHLGECLAGYAFMLVALGTDGLSKEGRTAFADIIAHVESAAGKPPARYEVAADDAFWLSADLLASRHVRAPLMAGEVALSQAVTQQTPELARRLNAKAAGRPRRAGGLLVTRAPLESVVLTNPESRASKYPHGNYFDRFGRPMGPKPAAPSTF